MRIRKESRAHRRVAIAAIALLPLSLTTACNLLGEEEKPTPIINNYIPGVSVIGDAGATSSLVSDPIPAGEAGGPTLTVDSTTTVINGGSVQVAISSDEAFNRVRVALEPLAAVAGATPSPEPSAPPQVAEPTGTPAIGYQEITLSAAATDIDLLLNVAPTLPAGGFALYYGVVNEAGTQGPLASQDVDIVQVASGDIQVSVSWDVDSDVDIHVVDADNEEIYWGNTFSLSGGELDLDSNAECDIDGVRNENITWETAPAGTYTVRLDYWDACGVESTNYVVTIRAPGQPLRTISGTFTGGGDQGEEGSGIDIGTFTVVAPAGSPSA